MPKPAEHLRHRTRAKKFLAQGASLPLGTPAEFGAHAAAEREKWGEVIRRAGIKME